LTTATVGMFFLIQSVRTARVGTRLSVFGVGVKRK
jgi:hypothetical protein